MDRSEVKRVEVPDIGWELFCKLDSGDWVGYRFEDKEVLRCRCQHCSRIRTMVVPRGATVFHFSCGACKGANQKPLLRMITQEEYEQMETSLQGELEVLEEKRRVVEEQLKEAKKLCSHASDRNRPFKDEGVCSSCGGSLDD